MGALPVDTSDACRRPLLSAGSKLVALVLAESCFSLCGERCEVELAEAVGTRLGDREAFG